MTVVFLVHNGALFFFLQVKLTDTPYNCYARNISMYLLKVIIESKNCFIEI